MLREGSVCDGVISRIGEFGVFVKFDGLEGLVHRSRIPGDDPHRPLKDQYSEGQRMTVRIIEFVEDERIRLQGLDSPSK